MYGDVVALHMLPGWYHLIRLLVVHVYTPNNSDTTESDHLEMIFLR